MPALVIISSADWAISGRLTPSTRPPLHCSASFQRLAAGCVLYAQARPLRALAAACVGYCAWLLLRRHISRSLGRRLRRWALARPAKGPLRKRDAAREAVRRLVADWFKIRAEVKAAAAAARGPEPAGGKAGGRRAARGMRRKISSFAIDVPDSPEQALRREKATDESCWGAAAWPDRFVTASAPSSCACSRSADRGHTRR